MSQIENHLRDALTDVADEIPADGVPPLNLPADPDNVVRLADHWDVGRRRRWLAPAAAAAAVVAIVTAAAVTSALPNSPAVNPVRQVPPYFLSGPYQPGLDGPVAIYSTATGRLVTVPKYRGRPFLIGDVAGSADGRTFVIASVQRLYLIRFNPATQTASVSLVPAPVIPGPLALEALALSPDGTELAVAEQPTASLRSGRHDLTVVDLATGRLRTWASSTGSFVRGPGYSWSLSWANDDRTVAFNWFAGWQKWPIKPLRPGSGVRLLNTALPGGDLVANSHLALPFFAKTQADEPAVSEGFALPAWLTPDGKTIVLPVAKSGWHRAALATYSARTGALKRTFLIGKLDRITAPTRVLWISRDGTTLIVYSAPGHRKELGIVRGNTYTSLPRPPRWHNLYSAW